MARRGGGGGGGGQALDGRVTVLCLSRPTCGCQGRGRVLVLGRQWRRRRGWGRVGGDPLLTHPAPVLRSRSGRVGRWWLRLPPVLRRLLPKWYGRMARSVGEYARDGCREWGGTLPYLAGCPPGAREGRCRADLSRLGCFCLRAQTGCIRTDWVGVRAARLASRKSSPGGLPALCGPILPTPVARERKARL